MSLPEKYAVRVDMSHPKFKEFKDAYNKMYSLSWSMMSWKYYGVDGKNASWMGANCWDSLEDFGTDDIELTIEQFLEAIKTPVADEWTPKYGEVVNVRDYETSGWAKRIYVEPSDTEGYPNMCVAGETTDRHGIDFKTGKDFDRTNWKYIQRIEPTVIIPRFAHDENGQPIAATPAVTAWSPQPGEMVEVRHIGGTAWYKRQFLCYLKGLVIVAGHNENPCNGNIFAATSFEYCRQIQPATPVTMQQIADALNIPVDLIKITDYAPEK